MRSYLDLVPVSARVHKRQSRMTRICIIHAVFLVTSIFSLLEMWMDGQTTAMRSSHGRFDGYIVLDADNVLDRDFILHMNETFSAGHDIVTCYRSSKNYGDNWISAGYALWFLRESRYLNGARSRLGSGCGVSGTGFLFSQTVLDAQGGGWPFHLLTEDIEFTINNVTLGMKVGSLYAIVVGPTTLKVPQPAMTFADFSIVWFIIGAAAVLALSAFKYRAAQRKVLSAQ